MSTPTAAALLLLLLPTLVLAQDRITGRPFATRSPVLARNGIAASTSAGVPSYGALPVNARYSDAVRP